ncbi:MAG: BamA/TamA family outer membrane protein [Alphaproteobacteria bacterium]|nr:BamA/TamA family outer membrane protein [Alphaproteobacteria bacterium]
MSIKTKAPVLYAVLLLAVFLSLAPLAYAFDIPGFSPGDAVKLVTVPPSPKLEKQLKDMLAENRAQNEEAGFRQPPPRRARAEEELIGRLMRAEGYYDATAQFAIDHRVVSYTVTTGAPFIVTVLKIDTPKGVKLPRRLHLAQRKNKPLRAEDVQKSLDRLTEAVQKNNCLYDVSVSYDARINRDNHTARLTLTVKKSAKAKVGRVRFKGLGRVKEDYALQKTELQPGACFNRAAVDQARLNLLQSNLFASVTDEVAPLKRGKADVTFSLRPRPPHTITAGAGYSSDEGPNVSAGWEHRNLFGRGEKLDLGAQWSAILQGVNSSLTFPDFHRKDQSLTLTGDVSKTNSDAYDTRALTLGATVTRKLSDHLSASLGTGLKVSRETGGTASNDTVGLVFFPASLTYDSRNDLLDPKSGWTGTAGLKPFIDSFDTGTAFLKSTLTASGYYSPRFVRHKRLTFAARAGLGSISGISLNAVPLDERFYAGGGGSVRGYPYQQLSPLKGSTPDGGRSYIETSFETRYRFTHDWGAVLFTDGGAAAVSSIPRTGEMRWAVGAGARYYTDFAPIRFDVAVPLARRTGIDHNYEFYISIGQAF